MRVCSFFFQKQMKKNTLMSVRLERKPVERLSVTQWNHTIADVLVHSDPAALVVLRWVLSTGDVKSCMCESVNRLSRKEAVNVGRCGPNRDVMWKHKHTDIKC